MPAESESPVKKLEIRKYPNRRYYDATHSRHLTLDEIQSLVQQGYDITVKDAKSGDDITAQVLTQIILELDTGKLNSFPVPLLVRLIRMNDQVTKEFIEKYFNQALKSFLDYQKQVEQQLRRAHGLSTDFPSVAAWTEAIFKPFTSAFENAPAAAPSSSPFEPRQAAPDADLREMVRRLEQQVVELKQRHERRPARARKRRRKT